MSDSIEARYQIVQERTLPVIVSEIHQIERTVYGVAMDGAVQIGEKLKEARAQVPPGEWVQWLDQNLNYSKSQAYNFIQIAEKYGNENSPYFSFQTSGNLSISKALELLRLPEEDVESFAESHDIENETVKSLRQEIASLKEEKQQAEHKADVLDQNIDKAMSDIADLQKQLQETVSETAFAEMQEAAQQKQEDLTKELNDAKAKLDKAKEDLKKAKAKNKVLEAAKDEEVQRGIRDALPDLEKKAREEGAADAAATLAKNAEDIERLQAEVDRLEADKAKLSDTSLVRFKIYCNQLQEIYHKITDIIDAQEDELAQKMYGALAKLMDSLN